jgi:hypothetical protein
LVTERAGRSFSEGREPERRSGALFSLALVQLNATHFQPDFGHSLLFGTFFKRKTALVISECKFK